MSIVQQQGDGAPRRHIHMTDQQGSWTKRPGTKFIATAVLTIAMSIPLYLVSLLTMDRAETQQQVAAEIAQQWGPEQQIVGPVLKIKFSNKSAGISGAGSTGWKSGVNRWMRQAVILPENMKVTGDIQTEPLHRGIYDVTVFSADVMADGAFVMPDLTSAVGKDVTIESAILSFTVTNPRGLQRQVEASWDGQPINFISRMAGPTAQTNGLEAQVDGLPDAGTKIPFKINLKVKGSGQLSFAPLARLTEVKLTSNWPHPSFAGAYLPNDREIGDRGFTASWQVPHLAQSFPKHWLTSDAWVSEYKKILKNQSFGVRFYAPVDTYQQIERALKYAILFIGLSFAAFLVIEVTSEKSIHVVQYMMIGLSQAIFYLLVLALSEHIGFSVSYLIAAVACIALVATYTRAVLGSARLAWIVAGMLMILYGVLHSVLQLADYALLVGSIALFGALSALMYATRNVDWDRTAGALSLPSKPTPAPEPDASMA